MADAFNSYSTNLGMNCTASPPRTISSAVGSIRGLSDRLDNIIASLNGLADQIGGPRPCGPSGAEKSLASSGILGDLHDAADNASSKVSTIDELVATISRQLG